jgi:hypothetical protein
MAETGKQAGSGRARAALGRRTSQREGTRQTREGRRDDGRALLALMTREINAFLARM